MHIRKIGEIPNTSEMFQIDGVFTSYLFFISIFDANCFYHLITTATLNSRKRT